MSNLGRLKVRPNVHLNTDKRHGKGRWEEQPQPKHPPYAHHNKPSQRLFEDKSVEAGSVMSKRPRDNGLKKRLKRKRLLCMSILKTNGLVRMEIKEMQRSLPLFVNSFMLLHHMAHILRDVSLALALASSAIPSFLSWCFPTQQSF